MPSITMISQTDASAEDVSTIENAVNEFNMAATGDRNWKPVRVFLRDEYGKICGGITADLWGGWMHIQYLWIDETLRKHGYGVQLLRAAEDEARAHGCCNAYLETFSFQARPFYEKQGYRLVAEMPDYPPGHSHYIMCKALV